MKKDKLTSCLKKRFYLGDFEVLSQRAHRNSCLSVNDENLSTSNRDFKIFLDTKSGTRHFVHLVAPTVQDKEAWISDISQCMDNIHMHSLLSPGLGSTSGGLYLKRKKINSNKIKLNIFDDLN